MRGQDHLGRLESRSIHILREAYACFPSLAMLWSIGKDSTVLLYLARKAFFGHVPFPLIHIDTSYKFPEMIEYRDALVRKWKLQMVVGRNEAALDEKRTFPDGTVDRLGCCRLLKTEALGAALNGQDARLRFNHASDRYEPDQDRTAYAGVIAGIRADEEGSRSKERYFSPRDENSRWAIDEQPPEFWDQFNTEVEPGAHMRVHPLLDWRELDIWDYIARENIPTVNLYYDQGAGRRYRSLGCRPCTSPIESPAQTAAEIAEELRDGKLSRIAERSGRAQDKDDRGTLEILRREGYM